MQEQHGEVPQQTLLEAVQHVVQAGCAMTFGGQPEQSDRLPDLVSGTSAVLHHMRPEDVVITPAEASTHAWVTPPADRFRLSWRDGAAIVLPLLRQIGSLYTRGTRSSIAHLDRVDLEIPAGGRPRLSLEGVPPASMKRLGKLLKRWPRSSMSGPSARLTWRLAIPMNMSVHAGIATGLTTEVITA